MNILDRIKNSLYQTVLRQRGSNRPKRTITNLADAHSVGIIYDSSDPDHDITITKFAEMLRNKGKKVDIIAYINDKKVDHKGDIEVFNPKAVNWYGVPLDDRVSAFCNKPFDLLICALLKESKPLEYIAYLSKAKYRIGPFDEQKTYCYDLMIEMGANSGLDYLLQQMIYFLEKIRYDKAN
jgi:hypothetical protein